MCWDIGEASIAPADGWDELTSVDVHLLYICTVPCMWRGTPSGRAAFPRATTALPRYNNILDIFGWQVKSVRFLFIIRETLQYVQSPSLPITTAQHRSIVTCKARDRLDTCSARSLYIRKTVGISLKF